MDKADEFLSTIDDIWIQVTRFISPDSDSKVYSNKITIKLCVHLSS